MGTLWNVYSNKHGSHCSMCRCIEHANCLSHLQNVIRLAHGISEKLTKTHSTRQAHILACTNSCVTELLRDLTDVIQTVTWTWDESSLFLLEVDPSFVTVSKFCNAVLGKAFVVQQLFWNKSILDQKRDSEKYQREYTGIRWKSILSFVVVSKFTNWVVASNCCHGKTFVKYVKVLLTPALDQKRFTKRPSAKEQ